MSIPDAVPATGSPQQERENYTVTEPVNSSVPEYSATTEPAVPALELTPAEEKGIRGAWLRYRVMAYVVGTLLVVLVVVGLPMKYIWLDDTVVRWTGIPHGWLYMVLLITAFDLGRRVKWGWGRFILIGLAGTVPFLSFVAEHHASTDVRAKLAKAVVTDDPVDS